jgi:hypothetical protein
MNGAVLSVLKDGCLPKADVSSDVNLVTLT